MERNWDMNDITDGHKYTKKDQVPLFCEDCKGCSSCCRDMGNSIQLDPFDVYSLEKGLNVTFDQLLQQNKIELQMVTSQVGDKGNMISAMILPNLKMQEHTGTCGFLDATGRCLIHAFRPGICRLFPLGRWYEDGSYSYFLQVHECPNNPVTKQLEHSFLEVANDNLQKAYTNEDKKKRMRELWQKKVKQVSANCQREDKIAVDKWIGLEDERYEAFVAKWHYFIKEYEERLAREIREQGQEAVLVKQMMMYVLMQFYKKAYDVNIDFYVQFEARFAEAKQLLQEM